MVKHHSKWLTVCVCVCVCAACACVSAAIENGLSEHHGGGGVKEVNRESHCPFTKQSQGRRKIVCVCVWGGDLGEGRERGRVCVDIQYVHVCVTKEKEWE